MLAIQGRLPGFNLTFRQGQSRSGAQVGEATVTGALGRAALWGINGVVARGNMPVQLTSSEVQCMEVRRGTRAALEFRRVTDQVYGAVILVWTYGVSPRRVTGACRS